MIKLVQMVCSFNFIIGLIFGVVIGYIFKPLIEAAINKLFKKNAG